MHSRSIVHRDLKPENILITRIEVGNQLCVRIADFGISTTAPKSLDGKMTQQCGTAGYIAPEIFSSDGYTFKCDIFSAGSILFNLLTGRFIFDAKDSHDLLIKNRECNLALVKSFIKRFSCECQDLILKLLSIN
jgi:serine/threonine protein kinase